MVEEDHGTQEATMPIFIIDGPEKAGKTTLISALSGLGQGEEPEGSKMRVRRWGPVDSVLEYFGPIVEDYKFVQQGGIVFWDRSWASECVYNDLVRMRETDRASLRYLETGPWSKYLIKIMAVSTTSTLRRRRAAHRDPTDHKVDPEREREGFLKYAKSFNWQIIEG